MIWLFILRPAPLESGLLGPLSCPAVIWSLDRVSPSVIPWLPSSSNKARPNLPLPLPALLVSSTGLKPIWGMLRIACMRLS